MVWTPGRGCGRAFFCAPGKGGNPAPQESGDRSKRRLLSVPDANVKAAIVVRLFQNFSFGTETFKKRSFARH
jgi:predicted dienelactone hydrolase